MIYFLLSFFLLFSSTATRASSSLEYDWSECGSFLSQNFSSQDFNCAPSTPPREDESAEETPLKKTPKKRNIISSMTHDVIEELESLLSTKTNGEIYVNSFFFTNISLAKTLVKIHKKNNGSVKITVLIDGLSSQHGRGALTLLKNAGIPIHSYRQTGNLNHNKQIFWTYVDEKGRNRYSLCDGSYNYTNLAANNVEQVVISRIKKHAFSRYKKHFLSILNQSAPYNPNASYPKQKAKTLSTGSQDLENIDPGNTGTSSSSSSSSSACISPIKPIKKVTLSHTNPILLFSPYDCVEDSMIAQINTTRPGGKIRILSYSFDLPPMKEALKKALVRGVGVRIVVDQYALINRNKAFKTSSLEQLKDLHTSGAKIFIYCDGGLLKIHTKIIALRDSHHSVVGQGSYNLTTSSSRSFNSFTWYPHKDSERMLDSIKEIYNGMKKKLIPFERILKNDSFAETKKMITEFIKKHTPKRSRKYVKKYNVKSTFASTMTPL